MKGIDLEVAATEEVVLYGLTKTFTRASSLKTKLKAMARLITKTVMCLKASMSITYNTMNGVGIHLAKVETQ